MSHVVYQAITNKKENNNDNLYKTMYNTYYVVPRFW